MNKVILAGVAALAFLAPSLTAEAASSDTYRQLNLFGDAFERVRSDYVESVEEKKLIEAAINGMLSSLDPHSSYLDAKSFRDMQIQTRGEFGGLGIEVTLEEGLVKVVAPIDDTPAARAGLQAGDLITHIDTEPVLGLTLADAVEKMRGPIGTPITLTVARPGAEEPFDVTLTRDQITVQAVRWRMEGDVGYVRVTAFNEQTEEKLDEGMRALQAENPNLLGYILDLRNNPGGLLDQAIAVSDAFLEQGEIVSTRGRHQKDTQRFNAREGDLANSKPVIVLINGGSASASEIVAGALQDHRRAIVLGEKSFGKGSVQTIIPLGSEGAIRLTTARYYTPSGRSIQAKGIEPDIEVQQARVEPLAAAMPHEADLRGHLDADKPANAEDDIVETPENVAKDKTSTREDKTAPAPTTGVTEGTKVPKAEAEPGSEEDYQLTYAIDLMRGLALMDKRVSR
jgi:carboxyl-terminal processing protease